MTLHHLFAVAIAALLGQADATTIPLADPTQTIERTRQAIEEARKELLDQAFGPYRLGPNNP